MSVQMLYDLKIIDEPILEFGYGQQVADPRDGLSLFGPYDADSPGHPAALSYGVVGTAKGLELFSEWSRSMTSAWADAPDNRHQLWPPYPGFQAAFASEWRSGPVWSHTLDANSLSDAARRYDAYERVYSVVNQYLSPFQDLQKLDERTGVIVCVVPDQVHNTCRIKARVSNRTGEVVYGSRIESRRKGQLEMFSSYDREQYDLSLDFRRQLKARAMAYDVPIQIVRESTLRLNDENQFGLRQLTPMPNRMWNLGSTLYTKGAASHGDLLPLGPACVISVSRFVAPMTKVTRIQRPALPRCSLTMETE